MTSGEPLEIKKGQREETFLLKVVEETGNVMGGISRAQKVIVAPANQDSEDHQWKMVVKDSYLSPELNGENTFGAERADMSEAERYYERWLYIKSIGIPTLSSMRLVGNKILMGDMTADGSVFFDKHSNLENYYALQDVEKDNHRELTKMEKMFLKIDPEEIKLELSRINEIAWNHNVVLPKDDSETFSILLHPDGTWKVVVVDLSFLRHIRSNNGDGAVRLWQNDNKEDLRRDMFKRLDAIRDNLTEIEKHHD